MTTGSSPLLLAVPELGGALGRIASPSSSATHPSLDDIRLTLATELFEAAGKARQLATAGDSTAAARALDPEVWSDTWERTVTAAGSRLSDKVIREFRNAARESRMPRPALSRWLPTEPERRAITAHLGKGTRRLDMALATLREAAARLEEDSPGQEDLVAWSEAVDQCARRVEAAWIELLEAAAGEEKRWSREVARVRRWRRPRWPLWIVTAVVAVAAVYLGLVAGGFLEPPEPLIPWAQFWWERL